jgi:hypothetical protein
MLRTGARAASVVHQAVWAGVAPQRALAQLCVQPDLRGDSSHEPIAVGRRPVNTALCPRVDLLRLVRRLLALRGNASVRRQSRSRRARDCPRRALRQGAEGSRGGIGAPPERSSCLAGLVGSRSPRHALQAAASAPAPAVSLGAGPGSRLRSRVCRSQPVVPLCFAQAPGRLRESTRQFGQVSRLRGRSHNYAFKRTAGGCFDVH